MREVGNDVREKALAFFRARRDEWRAFVSEGVALDASVSIVALAKFFMLKLNMPFDMGSYMRAQAARIRESLGGLEDCDPVRRQLQVADWLQRNAQQHRDQIIMEQARDLEAMGDDFFAELRAMVSDLIPASGK